MPRTYTGTYIPFRPGPELLALIQRHADRTGVSRSEAIRSLLWLQLRKLYPN